MSALSVLTAIARRIAGPYGRRDRHGVIGASTDQGDSQRVIAALQAEVDELRGEVGDLRERVGELDEVQNRLDFAERMLAQIKERQALPGGPDA